ncbi:hypothetical protein SRCM100169_02380 [Bacillus siamensis]|nr:hypothetical protein SRCM100169_02380 [Bacillus siamensis]
MKKVSVNVGYILEKENLSPRSLADKCEIRHAALSNLINGKRQGINFGHIEQIGQY